MTNKVELSERDLENVVGGKVYGEGNSAWWCKICGDKLGFRYTWGDTLSAQLAGYAMEAHENKYHGYHHDLEFWGLTEEQKAQALSMFPID